MCESGALQCEQLDLVKLVRWRCHAMLGLILSSVCVLPRPPFSAASPLQHRRISSVTLAAPAKGRANTADRKQFKGKNRTLFVSVVKGLLFVSAISFLVYGGIASKWKTSLNRASKTTDNGRRNTYNIDETSKPSKNIPVSSKDRQPSFASLGQAEQGIISKAWNEAINSLVKRSISLFEHWFEDDALKSFDLPNGIPGTGISTAEEARSLQNYLDCFASNGEWAYGPNGAHLNGSSLPVNKHSSVLATCDKAYYKHSRASFNPDANNWDVRPSLKWYWKPSPSCTKVDMPHWFKARLNPVGTSPALVSRASLCNNLRHKNVLLIGDSPTHYLAHNLLLDWTSKRPLTCYGDLYCKEHAICPEEIVQNTVESSEWDADVRVFESVQDPPGRATENALIKNVSDTAVPDMRTFGTVLRYRRADSMFMNSSPSHERHQPAFIHPHTGVRDINMYSVADGRRSDVTILYKAPIPYPRLGKISSGLHRRMLAMTKAIEDPSLDVATQITKIIELARLATAEIWLPEFLESLRALKAPPAPSDSLIIYRSGWSMQASCGHDSVEFSSEILETLIVKGDGPQPFMMVPDLGQILFSQSIGGDPRLTVKSLRTIFYNVQNVLQNNLVRATVAPRLGMPFIDLETATRAWRSGYVGGAGATQGVAASTEALRMSTKGREKPLDCLRMCLPSPGLSLETFFLGSLHTVFDWGWGGPERSRVWKGSNFVPTRVRQKTRTTGAG